MPTSKHTLPAMTGLAFFLAATSVAAEPVTAAAPAAKVTLARRVVDRKPLGGAEPFRPGEKAIAFSSIVGVDAGFVEHVWYRDGHEVARHYLPVGSKRRWRTWSRHTVQAGHYAIEIIAPDGKILARDSFLVDDWEELDVEEMEGC